jgi:hypothetical protein
MFYVKVNESGTTGQSTAPKDRKFSHRDIGILTIDGK